MIFLTGDVHDFIENAWEQQKINEKSDLNSAEKYLRILEEYKLKATLFINGSLLDKYPEKIRNLLKYDIEFGGHTYNNFGKMNLFKSYLNRKRFECVYGSKEYQEKDIKKTKLAFGNLGLQMRSWRTHAFASNEETFGILKDNEVKFVSDLLGEQIPFEKSGVMHMPINIPVDQNTIAYGELKPENRDPFASCTKGRIKPEEWFEILKKRILENEKEKKPSIILIHPMTMEVLDNFDLFKKIAKFLSEFESKKISGFSTK